MTEILAELSSRLHNISIHMGNGDTEQDVAGMYAIEDALEDAKTAALVLGITL